MYLALISEEVERSNAGSNQPVRKTGLRSFHDRLTRRWKGGH